MWEALGKAVPEDTPAWWSAHNNPLFIGNDARKIDPRTGWHPQLFIGGFWSDGGGGAIHGHDGWNATNLVISAGVGGRASIEWAEIKAPMRIWNYALNQDSEGAGKWRGSPGTIVEYEVFYFLSKLRTIRILRKTGSIINKVLYITYYDK